MSSAGLPIARLPDTVINQIAAGEVIERPASVVKELVENALDAGAGRVTVEVEGGGRRLIRVIDDGCGMAKDQLALALVRHATSKLRDIADLSSLRTMGFRGEALPSIASVSRMTVITRPRHDPSSPGWRVELAGGALIDESEHGAPIGTQIEVRDLLYNLPARQKFMKGEATEMAHVSEAVVRLAMAHPDVHLRLANGSRTIIDAPPAADDLERVCRLLPNRVADRLSPASGRAGAISVRAYLSPPELAQSTARAMHFFVGKRWVRDRGLVHAVLTGYGELIPRGRYPACVVFLDIDGREVDVNVHPQKLEVRFADAQSVYAVVRHAVRAAIARAPWLSPEVGAFAQLGPIGRGAGQASSAASIGAPSSWAPVPMRSREMARDYARSLTRSLFSWRSGRADPPPNPFPNRERVDPSITPSAARAGREHSPNLSPSSALLPSPSPSPTATPPVDATPEGFFGQLRYLGQLDRTYLVCERDGELVLIDQHAAHERVAFQRIKERHRARQVPRQRLLFPRTISIDAVRAAAAREAASALDQLGFEIEPFGAGEGGHETLAIKAVPSELRQGEDPEALLGEILDELAAGHGLARDRDGSHNDLAQAIESRLDQVFATIACHSVVRAGDPLGPAEVASLLDSLDGVDFAAHCPHGRPVLLRLRVDEIAKRLGRS